MSVTRLVYISNRPSIEERGRSLFFLFFLPLNTHALQLSSHIHCALDQLIGAQVTLDLHFFKLIQSAAKQQAEERGPAAAAALTAPLWRCRVRQAAGQLA